MARRALLVAAALEHALLDQALQPRLQHVARDPEAALEVVEPPHASERVTQDEDRPPLAHDLERPRDGAVLPAVCAVEHTTQSSARVAWRND